MRKLFKGQRILSVLYILASIGMFLFALAFMTEYSDLFGLKLPAEPRNRNVPRRDPSDV